jgi:hypothetical protein
MAEAAEASYAFDRVPIAPVSPGTNLLVTGPALDGGRGRLMDLIASPDDGVLVL